MDKKSIIITEERSVTAGSEYLRKTRVSRVNTCWKIVDTETGLFWNGYNAQCNHVVGTRFERRSSLDDAVKYCILHGGFPKTWDVVEVRLSETEMGRLRGEDVVIDYQIETELPKILKQRFSCNETETGHGVTLFRRMRRKGEFDACPFIGLRSGKYTHSWPTFKSALKGVTGDLTGRLQAETGGWVLFADKEAATMARLTDTLKGVGEIKELKIAFSRAIGLPVDRI
jgi:hypothetical protein